MKSHVEIFRSFVSLKWKILFTLSSVLLLLNIGMAHFAYMETITRLEQQQETIRAVKIQELSAAFKRASETTSTLAYVIPLLVGEGLLFGHEAAIGQWSAALDEHALMLNVEWGIEGLHFFSADDLNEASVSWPHGRAVPSVADGLRAAAEDDAVLNRVLCADRCMHVSVLPLLNEGVTAGVLVVEQTIGDILSSYNRLSGQDVAFLRKNGVSKSSYSGFLLPSRNGFAGETGGAMADRVLPVLGALGTADIGEGRPHRVGVGADWYEVTGVDVLPVADDVSALLVSLITPQVEASQAAIRNSIGLGIAGFLASEAVLFLLMWGAMQRVQSAIDVLPLLADRAYAQLRDRLPATPPRNKSRDEVDAMLVAIDRVADRMESLDEAYQNAAQELRRTQTGLQLARAVARVVGWSGEPLSGTFLFAEGAEYIHPTLGEIRTWTRFLDLVHPEDRIAVLKAWRSGRPGSSMDVEFRLRLGALELHMHAVAQFEAFGPTRILRAVGMIHDVTEIRMTQRELRSRQQRLSAELDVRSREFAPERNPVRQPAMPENQLLADMSHEIRTPLTAVIGLSQIGLQESRNRQVARTFEQIQFAGEHLMHVVNNVLDYSKLDAEKVEISAEPFVLAEMIEQCAEMFRLRAENKGVAMRSVVDPGLPIVVQGDRFRLQQILINLLGNAVKFTSRGEVALEAVPLTGQVGFRVRDTGIGVSQSQLHQLFDPYVQFSAEESAFGRGTGLGLTISQHLAVLMGGNISVQSEPGIGSLFTLRLPLPAATQAQLQQKPLPPTSTGSPKLTGVNVLIADDVAVNRTVVEHLLRVEGATVECVTNGREAVEAVASNKNQSIDIVLMDVQMPDLDGREATRRIRSAGVEVPVIGVTADLSEQEKLVSLQAGMQDQLVKPLMRESLVNVILMHIGHGKADQRDHAVLH